MQEGYQFSLQSPGIVLLCKLKDGQENKGRQGTNRGLMEFNEKTIKIQIKFKEIKWNLRSPFVSEEWT